MIVGSRCMLNVLHILNGCGSVVYVACSGQAQATGGTGETEAGGADEKAAGNVVQLSCQACKTNEGINKMCHTPWRAQSFQMISVQLSCLCSFVLSGIPVIVKLVVLHRTRDYVM
jgi:hypothetical protein